VNQRYATLDGLRGLAAFAVMLLHLLPKGPPNAYLAVDFFFALSGFVVAHAYEGRLRAGLGFLEFARLRVLRLLPLALLGVGLGAVLLASSDAPVDGLLVGTALNGLLLPSWSLDGFSPFAFAGDPPLWSLCFELLINLAYALVAARLTTRRLVLLTVAFGALTPWAAVANQGLDVGWSLDDFGLGVVRVLFPFSCGVLLRRLPLPPLGRVWLWPTATVLLAVLFCPLKQGSALAIAAVLLVFPGVVAVGAAVRTGPALSAALGWLGRVSYPLYVLHGPVVRGLAKIAGQPLQGALALYAVVLCVTLAHAAAGFYDEPVRAWLNRRLPARARPVPLAEAA
jgi:peptidoglycan/LPS O-acetylase OafA/YrhL